MSQNGVSSKHYANSCTEAKTEFGKSASEMVKGPGKSWLVTGSLEERRSLNTFTRNVLISMRLTKKEMQNGPETVPCCWISPTQAQIPLYVLHCEANHCFQEPMY